MAKGATSPQTQTTQVVNPNQAKLVKWAMPYAKEFATGGGPKLFDGSLVAGFDPLQTQGQEAVLGSTGAMGDIVGAAGTGNQFLASGDVLRPESNPALRATIDASTRPIIENLMEQALPGIRGGAVTTGNFGSSRQGIAEGLATGRAAQAVGDTAAKVATAGYNSGLGAMTDAQKNAATIAQAQSLPGQTTSAVGDVRQALAQALLGEQGQRFNYEQQLPLLMAKELMGLASGTPGGQIVTTASTPQANPIAQYAGLGTAAGGLMTGAANLLPVLMGMSDPKAKENIVQIGELFDKTPIYRFTYKGSRMVHVGLMADKVCPEAVTDINGVLFVDYDKATEEAARIGGGL